MWRFHDMYDYRYQAEKRMKFLKKHNPKMKCKIVPRKWKHGGRYYDLYVWVDK